MAGKRTKPDPDALPTLNKQEIEALMKDVVAHKAEQEPMITRDANPPHNKALGIHLTYPQTTDLAALLQEPECERMRATLIYFAYEALPTAIRKGKGTLPIAAEWHEGPDKKTLECRITGLANVSDFRNKLNQAADVVAGQDADAKEAMLQQIRDGFEKVKPKLYQHGQDIKSILDR